MEYFNKLEKKRRYERAAFNMCKYLGYSPDDLPLASWYRQKLHEMIQLNTAKGVADI